MKEYKDFLIVDNEGYHDIDVYKKTYLTYEGVLKTLHPHYEWVFHEEQGYQGEWFALGKYKYKGNFPMFVYHQGSFGSCSGCDWLLGISSEEEMLEFIKSMDKVTPCGDTFDDALNYLIKEKQSLTWANEALDAVIKESKKKWGFPE